MSTTAAGWKAAATHEVLCPSGFRVKIRIPNLPAMIEAGELPQHLLDAALGVARGGDAAEPSIDLIKKQREFTDHLVMKSVIEPTIEPADLREIPFEDMEFIVQIATRQRDLDAEGEHIGGLTKSEKFRKFRGLGEFDPNVEGL